MLTDAQVRENRIFEEHESPALGRIRQPRPAAIFDRTPAKIRRLAPSLGEDNAGILRELGYPASEIERLERDRVLICRPYAPPAK